MTEDEQIVITMLMSAWNGHKGGIRFRTGLGSDRDKAIMSLDSKGIISKIGKDKTSIDKKHGAMAVTKMRIMKKESIKKCKGSDNTTNGNLIRL